LRFSGIAFSQRSRSIVGQTETGMTIGVRTLQDPLAVLDAWIAKQNAPELSVM
jgi:hypothetical protein